MKAISLWQPWATWIAWGLKTVETRGHNRFACLKGQRIAIHAANHWDDNAMSVAKGFLRVIEVSGGERGRTATSVLINWTRRFYPFGRVVCTTFISATRELTTADDLAALCECYPGRFGLFAGETVRVGPNEPLGRPRPGMQGIFEVENAA